MQVTRDDLRERYRQLSDHKLADLVRGGGLTDEAHQVLLEELRRRGLNDATVLIDELNAQDRLSDQHRAAKLEKKTRQEKFRRTVSLTVCTLIVLLGAIRFFAGDQAIGTLTMAIGVGAFILYWLTSRLRIAAWKFIFRR